MLSGFVRDGAFLLTDVAIYALIGVGITLVFSMTRFVNFAHGDLATVGAYLAISLGNHGGLGIFIGVLVAIGGVGLVGLGLERGVFRFTMRKPVNGFLCSLGLILIIENTLDIIAGPGAHAPLPVFRGVVTLARAIVPTADLTTIATAAVTLILVDVCVRHTRVGLALRAGASDREMAGLLGARTTFLFGGTFVLAGALAGVTGVLLAVLYPLTPTIGYNYVVTGFVVALVGGLGNVRGALLAAFLLGLVELGVTLGGLGLWQEAIGLGVMAILLVARPTGLLRGVGAEI